MNAAGKRSAIDARIRTLREAIDQYHIMGERGTMPKDFAVFQSLLAQEMIFVLESLKERVKADPN